jgi:hypothetical protein
MAGLLTGADYPPQDELTRPAGIAYRQEALRRGAGVDGRDVRCGDNIYQRIALFVPKRPPRMEAALRAAGGECERIIFEGCDHFKSSMGTVDPEKPWLSRSIAWMANIGGRR